MLITIDDYAKRFKMSKEMIRAKIRAGRLAHTVVDGETLIELQEEPATPNRKAPTTAGAIILMYQKENARLKAQVERLEAKIDKLIDDKEKMLRDELERVEAIYAKRDEQLKSFLELVNARLLRQHDDSETIHDTRPLPPGETDHADAGSENDFPKRIELQRYLRLSGYTPQERKVIKRRFAKAYGNDTRVLQENGEFILDFTRYDYSDLLTR